MSFVSLFVTALLSANGSDVVARVDEVAIGRGALARRITVAAEMGVKLDAAGALDNLIAEAVLAADARRAGLGDAPEVRSFVESQIRKAAATALVESFATKREADDATLREMFHASADFVTWEFLAYASQEDARAARQRIDEGGSLAAEEPKALTAKLSPKQPTSMRAQLPRALASALFAAAPGSLVGPVEGENGWLVARVVGKEVGSDAAFAARRPALVASFNQQTRDAARSHLVEQLKAKSNVKLDETFLRGLEGTSPSRDQLAHVVATVAGAPVTYADVYPKVAALGGQAGHMASPSVKVQLAWSVVNDRVVEAFAVERGFDKAPDVASQRPELERNALAQLLAGKIEIAVKPPTDREIEAQYQKDAARYGRPLKEIRRYVAADAYRRKAEEAVRARVAELRAKASISIDQAALARSAS